MSGVSYRYVSFYFSFVAVLLSFWLLYFGDHARYNISVSSRLVYDRLVVSGRLVFQPDFDNFSSVKAYNATIYKPYILH